MNFSFSNFLASDVFNLILCGQSSILKLYKKDQFIYFDIYYYILRLAIVVSKNKTYKHNAKN